MFPLRGRVVRWLAGSSESNQWARWHQNGRTYEFEVPGDNLWIAIKDDFLLREYDWMGAPPGVERGTVVDAGAHVGTFTAIAAAHAERVVAIEPNPSNLELLRQNLDRNGIDNVEIIDAALWPDGDHIELAVDGPTSSSSVVVGSQATVTVATIALDELVDRVGRIDLLKLDIEGAEFDLLLKTDPAVLAQVETMVGELHLWATDAKAPTALTAHLEQAGFDVEVRLPPIFHPGESLRALRRNWSSVDGHLRLKLTIAATYAIATVVRHIPRLRDRLATEELRLFVARRRH